MFRQSSSGFLKESLKWIPFILDGIFKETGRYSIIDLERRFWVEVGKTLQGYVIVVTVFFGTVFE